MGRYSCSLSSLIGLALSVSLVLADGVVPAKELSAPKVGLDYPLILCKAKGGDCEVETVQLVTDYFMLCDDPYTCDKVPLLPYHLYTFKRIWDLYEQCLLGACRRFRMQM